MMQNSSKTTTNALNGVFMAESLDFGGQMGDFRDSSVDLVQSELRDRGHLAIDRVVEWSKGEKQVSLARVILADEARRDSFQEPL